ncbi:hypothetical protein BJ138DRAFT_1109827 [Hygrophoropsis aurantiaca]|uniref:Uncharacterized protein n=1 Tax=Hygrophoropsis aurantiaca TaxID=72124 RepID=A0ACB8AQR7_9AGAM|nr:hypothetical protein BJ138DRAFT_1109827 [Hygrophoropsis aurantiaca]
MTTRPLHSPQNSAPSRGWLLSAHTPQSQMHSQSQHTQPQPQTESVFAISVDDPQRVGDPVRAYTMCTVHTKLYGTLSSSNPGVIIPPVPEKKPFGRFDGAFAQQRYRGLQKCTYTA